MFVHACMPGASGGQKRLLLSGVNECCEPPSKCWESKSRLLQK